MYTNIRERMREALRPVLDFGYEDMPDKQDEAIDGILAVVHEELVSDDARQAVFDIIDDAVLETFTAVTGGSWPPGVTSDAIIGEMRRQLAKSRPKLEDAAWGTALGLVEPTSYVVEGDVGYRK